MELFKQWRLKKHASALSKSVARSKQGTNRSIPLSKAQSIGILLDATDAQYREKVVRFAKKMEAHATVTLLGFYNDKVAPEGISFAVFTKKELSFWELRPSGEAVDAFLRSKFDVLLTAQTRPVFPLELLAAESNARFKMGPASDALSAYHFMVHVEDAANFENYVQQVLNYSEKLTTRHEKSLA